MVYLYFYLQMGYYQIEIKPAYYISAFACKFGLFEFKVMPFVLANAPSSIQYFMNEFFTRFEEFYSISLDNIFVYSNCVQQHLGHLFTVFLSPGTLYTIC